MFFSGLMIKDKIRNFFNENQIELANQTLIVAVSGGADSMSLLANLSALKKSLGFEIVIAHVNHQLRPDSKRESEVILKFAQAHDLIVEERNWEQDQHPRSGVEAAARDFRYRYFYELAEKYQTHYILTAHNADDVLENILMKLVRSGNPFEMASLAPVRAVDEFIILRPVLTIEKSELLNFCKTNQVPFVEDETNQTDFTLRNRLRHQVIPLLKNENAKITNNGLNFQDSMNEIQTDLDAQVAEVPQPEKFVAPNIISGKLATLPTNRLVRALFLQQTVLNVFDVFLPLTQVTFDLESEQKFDFGQGMHFISHDNSYYLFNDQEGSRQIVIDETNTENAIGSFMAPKNCQFQVANVNSGMQVLLESGHHQKLKKRFLDQKIPAALRKYFLAVVNSNTNAILWVDRVYENQRVESSFVRYFIHEC